MHLLNPYLRLNKMEQQNPSAFQNRCTHLLRQETHENAKLNLQELKALTDAVKSIFGKHPLITPSSYARDKLCIS